MIMQKYLKPGTIIPAGVTVTLMHGSRQIEERTLDEPWELPTMVNDYWWSAWSNDLRLIVPSRKPR